MNLQRCTECGSQVEPDQLSDGLCNGCDPVGPFGKKKAKSEVDVAPGPEIVKLRGAFSDVFSIREGETWWLDARGRRRAWSTQFAAEAALKEKT